MRRGINPPRTGEGDGDRRQPIPTYQNGRRVFFQTIRLVPSAPSSPRPTAAPIPNTMPNRRPRRRSVQAETGASGLQEPFSDNFRSVLLYHFLESMSVHPDVSDGMRRESFFPRDNGRPLIWILLMLLFANRQRIRLNRNGVALTARRPPPRRRFIVCFHFPRIPHINVEIVQFP